MEVVPKPVMPVSRYLPHFSQNQPQIREQLELIGDVLLVERVEFPEIKVGSIIIADYSNKQSTAITADKPFFVRVLLTGEGFYDDTTKEDIPVNVKQGDIILIGAVSAKMFSTFPIINGYTSDSIGITRESDIQIRFKGEAAFNAFLQNFDASIQAAKNG